MPEGGDTELQSAMNPEKRLHMYLDVLSHLGWGLGRAQRPKPLKIKDEPPACWTPMRLPDGSTLVILALGGGLPDTSESFQRYEDIAPRHLELFRQLEAVGIVARHVLLLPSCGGQLVDCERREVLVTARSQDELTTRITPLLNLDHVGHGQSMGFPCKSIHEHGRELSDWSRVWSARIGSRLGVGPAVVTPLVWWTLLLHAARFVAPGWASPQLGGGGDHLKALQQAFRVFQERHNLLQKPGWKQVAGLAAEVDRANLLEPFRASLDLLSRSKFSSEAFAEGFLDEELRQVSWRSAVLGAKATRGGHHLEETTDAADRVQVDLDEVGAFVLLATIDELCAKTHQRALEHQAALERGERPGIQLDLLSEAPDEPHPREAVQTVLARGLKVVTSRPHRADYARLVIATKAMELLRQYDGTDRPLPVIPVAVTGDDSQPSNPLSPAHQAPWLN